MKKLTVLLIFLLSSIHIHAAEVKVAAVEFAAKSPGFEENLPGIMMRKKSTRRCLICLTDWRGLTDGKTQWQGATILIISSFGEPLLCELCAFC
jgi:hypothetical protein